MGVIHTGYRRFILRASVCFLVSGLLVASVACARKGLISEKYPSDFYHVPKLLPDGPMDKNPQFIFYGDSRPGWRDHEKFLNKRNWLTWKMALFPFYEFYWLANGIGGGINRLRSSPNYGSQERLMVRDAVYKAAKRSKADFILHGGDISTDGRRPSGWAEFITENKIERPLMSEFPFLPVISLPDTFSSR